MTDSQRSGSGRRTTRGARKEDVLERRRTDMKSAEGHAGSVPRGNPEREAENEGQQRAAYERVLGH